MPAIDTMLEAFGGEPLERRPREEYVESRFPSTYAYDYFRQCLPSLVSRGEAAGLIRRYCERNGINREAVIIALAYRYLEHYNLEKP